MERVRSFPYQIVNNYPVKVVAYEWCVVVGGDDGVVRVFDITNCHNVLKLSHGAGTFRIISFRHVINASIAGQLVQTVLVSPVH